MKLQQTIGRAALIWVIFLNLSVAETPKDDKDYSLAIGVTAFQQDSIYMGGDSNDSMAVMVEWEWENWFISDFSAGSYLAATDNWYLAAAIDYDVFGDVERGGSDQLADMRKLENAYTLSLKTGYESEWGQLELSFNQDISNTHNGNKVEASYSLPFVINKWQLRPSFSIEYVGSSVVDYWVGVSKEEVKEGRAEYSPDSGLKYTASFTLSRVFMHKHLIIFDITHKEFSEEITDSPIIDNDSVSSVSAGYLYVF